MEYNDLIQGFAAKFGIEGTATEDGITMFEIDGLRFAVIDEAGGGRILLYGILGEAAPDASERLCRTLLEANHLLMATKGATLSRNPETGEFALCQALKHPDELEVDGFSDVFKDFVDTSELWHKVIAGLSTAETLATKADEEDFPPSFPGHSIIPV